MNLRRLYWRCRILWMALQQTPRPCLGDEVEWDGRRWTLTQGVKNPEWTLRRGDPEALPSDAESAFVHRDEFRKVKSLSNYWHSFSSTYRFYMGCWFTIWCRGWRMPQ